MGRMRGIVAEPAGLRYVPDLLGEDEDIALLDRLTGLEYGEVRMHGQVARRVVRHYGVRYSFDTAAVTPGDPIPAWLEDLRSRSATLLGTEPGALAEVLVTRYPPGATIGWHRDAPAFGEIVGVSFGSECLLRFQRGTGTERRVYEQAVAPRSAYVLAGKARTVWQHSIPAVPAERYSITFRTLRGNRATPPTA
jgi:alkylated DNA repair protein (DNA oxidative demethylase)